MKYPLLISPFTQKKTTSPVEMSEDTTFSGKYPLLKCDDKTSLYVFLLYLAKGISNPLSARAIEGYIITSIETRILRFTLEHMHKNHPYGLALEYTGIFSRQKLTHYEYPVQRLRWTNKRTYRRLERTLKRLREIRNIVRSYKSLFQALLEDIHGLELRSNIKRFTMKTHIHRSAFQREFPDGNEELLKYVNPSVELALKLKKLTSPDKINRDTRKKVLELLLHSASTMGFKAALD